jgi:hypothetical protein
VPAVLSALSASPQMNQALRPQSAGPAGGQLQPQFDWGSLVGPPIIDGPFPQVLGALSSSPQITPQSAGPAGGQLQPQFDWGSLVGPIVQTVVPAVLSALSASPQVAAARQYGASVH